MSHAPTELYASGLEGEILFVRRADGSRRPLPLTRWLGPLGAIDARALKRAPGPVLDVGCGPGRHVLALARRGVLALGVDIAPAAVRHARGRGAAVLLGSVFAPIPGAGHWRTALLLDGNIGIGGRPVALLSRIAGLLAPHGHVLCELEPPGTLTDSELIALEDGRGTRSSRFAWATVGADGVGGVASRAGLEVSELWEDGGRWFVLLARSHHTVSNSSSTASA